MRRLLSWFEQDLRKQRVCEINQKRQGKKDNMSMTLHFLNVGNGDCTIIELPDGNLMMVDICNGGKTGLLTKIISYQHSSLSEPISYLEQLYYKSLFNNPLKLLPTPSLFLYVQTHPDMDHMDGLAALNRRFFITNFLDTANTKAPPNFSLPYSKGSPEDWEAYQQLRRNARFFYRSLSPITLQGGIQFL